MMRAAAGTLLLLGLSVVLASPLAAGEELAPITAAEAARRTAESRDFLTDMLWLNTEGHWHEGRWGECIRLCRQIVQLDPQFVEAYTSAAWLLWSTDRDEDAIELYRAGIAANPDSYQAYHEFGMYFWHEQKWEQAAEQFRKSVANGAPQALQRMLPNALERAGRIDEAIAEWRELLRRFPDDPIAKNRIERLEKELEQEKKVV